MGGGACVVIINGNKLQGEAGQLSSTVETSCQLVDYLSNDEYAHLKPEDIEPIEDFHARTIPAIKKLNKELDEINRALAAKYNRVVD